MLRSTSLLLRLTATLAAAVLLAGCGASRSYGRGDSAARAGDWDAAVEHYRRAGWQVVNADVAPPRNPQHASCWTKLDILDAAAFGELVRAVDPDVFVHLAARTDLRGTTAADYAVNVDGVRNAIAAARSASALSAAVFASSVLAARSSLMAASTMSFL